MAGFNIDKMKEHMGRSKEQTVLRNAIDQVGPLSEYEILPTDLSLLSKQIMELQQLGGKVVYEVARRLKHAHDNKIAAEAGMSWEQWVEITLGMKKSYVS